MTQTDLALTASPVEAWADAHDGATFADLCDAFPGMSATDVNEAARRVLRWRDGGYQVGREAAEGERL